MVVPEVFLMMGDFLMISLVEATSRERTLVFLVWTSKLISVTVVPVLMRAAVMTSKNLERSCLT